MTRLLEPWRCRIAATPKLRNPSFRRRDTASRKRRRPPRHRLNSPNMSLMRHSIQHRAHKERAQPREREKWGLLEKHKDYTLRARDYNAKKKRLHILRAKAAERNPDEFHFGMLRARTHHGTGEKVADRGNKALSHDVVKLLKTQDAGYLQVALQQTQVARRRAEEELRLGDSMKGWSAGTGDGQNGKIVFAESVAEQRAWGADASADASAEAPEDSSDASGDEAAPRAETPAERAARQRARTERKRRRQRLEKKRGFVAALLAREQELLTAQRELALQRARMGNARGGTTKAGKRFKIRERKR